MKEQEKVAEQAREGRILAYIDALYEREVADRHGRECLEVERQFAHDRMQLQEQYVRQREDMAKAREWQTGKIRVSAYQSMLEVAPLIQEEFDMSCGDADRCLDEWVRAFGERRRRLTADMMRREEGAEEYPYEEQVLSYLDSLREGGRINMIGAMSLIQEEFSVGRREAQRHLAKWMRTAPPAGSRGAQTQGGEGQ